MQFFVFLRRNVGIPPYTQKFIIKNIRARAEPFLNFSLFIFHYSLKNISAPCGTDGSSGRRPLRFLWIRAKLAVRRISLLPSAKISHCVSNISHAFAYITRAGRGGYHPPECLRIHQSSVSLRSTAIWLPREGAGERSETEGVNKGAKRQAILYKNRSEATLNYALRIANYTLYNRVRAEPFLNYSLFIIH